jgi:hypothetical protein
VPGPLHKQTPDAGSRGYRHLAFYGGHRFIEGVLPVFGPIFITNIKISSLKKQTIAMI